MTLEVQRSDGTIEIVPDIRVPVIERLKIEKDISGVQLYSLSEMIATRPGDMLEIHRNGSGQIVELIVQRPDGSEQRITQANIITTEIRWTLDEYPEPPWGRPISK